MSGQNWGYTADNGKYLLKSKLPGTIKMSLMRHQDEHESESTYICLVLAGVVE